MANPSTKPAREASPIAMHIAATRLLLLLPIFGTVGWTEDIAGKVLLAAVIVESIDLRGNERIAVTNKDTGTEEAQMMESAGAAEPSSETDSIHSFTLKSGSRIYRPATTTAGMPANSQIRILPQLTGGKYYFRSLLVPTKQLTEKFPGRHLMVGPPQFARVRAGRPPLSTLNQTETDCFFRSSPTRSRDEEERHCSSVLVSQ